MLAGMAKKVAISVPDDLLAEVDAESEVMQISRSRLFTVAATGYIEASRRARAVEQYVRSYKEYPETDDELEATDAFLRAAWAAGDR